MKLIAIAAVDNNWAIGKNNSLLFKLPADMKHFRDITTGHFVVCGYNTLMSFPNGKALPNRVTICLTHKDIVRDDCIIMHSLAECLEYLNSLEGNPEVYVIGGAAIYKEFLPYYDEAIITKVNTIALGADASFPNLDKSRRFIKDTVTVKTVDNGYETVYITYKKRHR